MYNEVMENTDFVIEHIDKEVKVITDRPSSVVNYPANTDFFIENIDDNVISIAHSLNIEASEVEFRPANTDFFIENIDNNVIMIAESLELESSEVTIRPANTDFFVENIDKNLIAIAEYYELEPSRVVLRPANTDMFIENIDRNVTLIKSRTNVITKSGSFINVDVPDGGTMQLTAINGNATQDGTPTPDSPVDVQVVTGENTVKISGKNLFDINSLAQGSVTVTDGVATGTALQFHQAFGTNGIDLPTISSVLSLRATAYTDGNSTTAQTTGLGIRVRYTDGTTSNLIMWDNDMLTATEKTATTSSAKTIEKIIISYNNAGANIWHITQLQLELGSQASDYQAYQGQEFQIDLGSIELAKIGTYQDKIYFDNGKWYLHKEVGKVVYTGASSEGWYGVNSNKCFNIDALDILPAIGNNTLGFIISNNYTNETYTALYNASVDYGIAVPNNTKISIRNKDCADATALKTWLTSHPTTVYYALATPTTTEITDETLLEQLNFVADMYEGINNISFIGTGAQGTIDIVINKY